MLSPSMAQNIKMNLVFSAVPQELTLSLTDLFNLDPAVSAIHPAPSFLFMSLSYHNLSFYFSEFLEGAGFMAFLPLYRQLIFQPRRPGHQYPPRLTSFKLPNPILPAPVSIIRAALYT